MRTKLWVRVIHGGAFCAAKCSIFHQKQVLCVVTFQLTCIYAHFLLSHYYYYYYFLSRKECIGVAWCIEETPQSAKLGSQGMLNSFKFHIMISE